MIRHISACMCAFILLSVCAHSQTKISEMPTLSGNPSGAYVAGYKGSTNYKIAADNLGYNKVDSIKQKAGTDSVFEYKNGIPKFRYEASGSIIQDSTVLTFDGLHPSAYIDLTHTGFKSVEVQYEDERAAGYVQSFNSLQALLQWQVALIGTYKFYLTYTY